MSELLLNYTDVSEKVTLSSCVHEMYAGGRSDSLHVRISDTDGQLFYSHVNYSVTKISNLIITRHLLFKLT